MSDKLNLREIFSELNIPFRDKGRYIMIGCPYHDESEPSLAVYLDNLTFYCFGCKKWGRYEELLARLLNKDPIEVFAYYNKRISTVDYSASFQFVPAMSTYEILPYLLLNRHFANSYLRYRGIKNPEEFNCGYDSLSKRLTIPVYFEEELVGFESRALRKDDPHKYKAHYFEKGNYIYGWDFLDWSLNYLIIVESSISVMYLKNTFGWSNCISFMGTVLSAKRKELIDSFNPQNIYVWFDNDLAGREASNKLLKHFKSILYIHSEKDPDELENLDDIVITKMEVQGD